MTELEDLSTLLSDVGSTYGMQVTCDDQAQAQKLAETLSRLPHALIAACGIKELGFKDLGVSREYFPNHGLYVDDKLFLNTQNIDDPIVHKDGSGRTLDRFEHTLYHELGHGLDKMRDNESQRDPWLSLSGWSKEPLSRWPEGHHQRGRVRGCARHLVLRLQSVLSPVLRQAGTLGRLCRLFCFLRGRPEGLPARGKD